MFMFLPAFTSIAHSRWLATGELLFRQGEQTTAIFAVKTGRVKLMRHTSEGVALSLHVARSGESFAEAALFSEVYHCDAVAELSSQIEIYPKFACLQVLKQQPEIAQEFVALLSCQVQELRSRLELRNVRSARDRILQYFSLIEHENTITFDRPLKDIASDLGLAHEVFYRTLAQLQRQGVIQYSKRQIKLCQEDVRD